MKRTKKFLVFFWSGVLLWLIGVYLGFAFLDLLNIYYFCGMMTFFVAGFFIFPFLWGISKPSLQSTPQQKENIVSQAPVVQVEDLSDPDIICRAEVFKNLDILGLEYGKKIRSLQEELQDKKQALVNDLFATIQERIPDQLRKKVEHHFVFSLNHEDKKKHNLPQLFLDEYRSSFGMAILMDLTFTKKELEELNQAWHPFIGIGVDYHHFFVRRPKIVQEELNAHLDHLVSLGNR